MAGFGAGVGEGVTSGAGEGDAALAAAAVNSTHIVSINTISFFMAQLYHGQVPCAICVNVKSIQRFCGYKVEHIICALYVGVYLRNLAYDYAFGYGRLRAYLYAPGYAGHNKPYACGEP